MTTINWKSLGTTLPRHLSWRTHFMKLIHGILPTNAVVHRRHTIRSLCPRCRTTKESWQHILRCPHESRVKWRQSLIKSVSTECKDIGTMPLLLKKFTRALHSWFQHNSLSTTPFQRHIDGASTSLRRPLFQQNQIGWDHVFKVKHGGNARWLLCATRSIQRITKETHIGIIWKHWMVL